MGKRAFGLAALAVVAMLFAGCAQFTRGTPIIRYERGSTDPVLAEATVDGEYALFKTFGSTDPVGTYALKKGDALGFERAETGQVVAVAGENKLIVPDANYVWKRR